MNDLARHIPRTAFVRGVFLSKKHRHKEQKNKKNTDHIVAFSIFCFFVFLFLACWSVCLFYKKLCTVFLDNVFKKNTKHFILLYKGRRSVRNTRIASVFTSMLVM